MEATITACHDGLKSMFCRECDGRRCPACNARPMMQGNGTPDMCRECTLSGALGRVLAAIELRTVDDHLIGYRSPAFPFSERYDGGANRLYDALTYARDVADVCGIDVPAFA